ncbi:MAG TPA: VOC family protein [Candidatus Saccharimonadales bacterium]|nr:VOC family protein [Candidatus Saccharimonadales bacterium]
MAKVTLEPYIFFKGNCREAMEFYKSVFGGELEIMDADPEQMGDMPNKDWFKGKVMHCTLKGGDITFMASDSSIASDKAAKVELSLGGTDEDHMRTIFDKLADGGKIEMPLEKQFWGDIFGRVTDQYGVQWMMNIGDSMDPGKK